MFEDHGQDEIELTQDELNAQQVLGSENRNPDSADRNASRGAAPQTDYGGEAGQYPSEGTQVAVDNRYGIDEEEELKKKIVLYYHTLVSPH